MGCMFEVLIEEVISVVRCMVNALGSVHCASVCGSGGDRVGGVARRGLHRVRRLNHARLHLVADLARQRLRLCDLRVGAGLGLG